jgi:hypothetical protein
MVPIAGVFVASTVAGFGATLGYRLARDVVVPALDRAAAEAGSLWDSMTRMDGSRAGEGAPGTDGDNI